MPYQIVLSEPAEAHLQDFTARNQRIVVEAIVEQLSYQPTVATKNRKLMRTNPLATWELRIGKLRVYYDVEEQPEPLVRILAIGIKERNQVWIGNKRVNL
ncbi:MAG: hypothetical protein SVX43_04500 [Cyanobacteriota bacterium]|nr:hypothetical protein [Cyanobacteriota bacterium]